MAKKNRSQDLHDPTPATHGDLNIWGNQITKILEEKADKGDLKNLVTKDDLKQELAKYATKEDIQKAVKQITDHFDEHIDTTVENRAADLLGVKKDEVREIQRKVKNHEERITVLER